MQPKQYLTELELALEQYRFREVRALTDQIDPSSFDLLQIKRALHLIRRKRRFADLEHAASLFNMAGNRIPSFGGNGASRCSTKDAFCRHWPP